MLGQILVALLPAIITIMLGYFAAWHHDFTQKEVPTLNRMVMTYALPLALFIGVFGAGREHLLADIPLLIFLFLAIVGTFAAVLLAGVFLFHQPPGLSAIRAITAAGPSTAFVGVPVLGSLYGTTASIPIAAGGIIIAIVLLPVSLILLGIDEAKTESAEKHDKGAPEGETPKVDISGTILKSLKLPVVWLPVTGFLLVLFNVDLPKVVDESLALLGHSSSGVALFASGIILAGYKFVFNRTVLTLVFIKNLVQPAIVCLGMLALGYGQPILGETVVTTALPAVALVVMMAVQYKTAIPEAASALLISTFGSLITITVFIWLVQ